MSGAHRWEVFENTQMEINPQRKKSISKVQKQAQPPRSTCSPGPGPGEPPGCGEVSLSWGLIRPMRRREDSISGISHTKSFTIKSKGLMGQERRPVWEKGGIQETLSRWPCSRGDQDCTVWKLELLYDVVLLLVLTVTIYSRSTTG